MQLLSAIRSGSFQKYIGVKTHQNTTKRYSL